MRDHWLTKEERMNSNATVTTTNANVNDTTVQGNLSHEDTGLDFWGMNTSEADQVEAGVNANAIDYQTGAVFSLTPDSTWLKADIVTWLSQNGVALTDKAQASMTKAELLTLVDEVLSPAPPE